MMDKSNLVLIVDDDKLDVKVLLKGLQDNEFPCRTSVVRNGKEALEYLSNDDNEKPCLIFLDINMPVMNGIEFLQKRKELDEVFRIPTIVFSTSRKKEDKNDCYDAGVAGYMVKPIKYAEFRDMLKVVKDYWVTNEFPEYA